VGTRHSESPEIWPLYAVVPRRNAQSLPHVEHSSVNPRIWLNSKEEDMAAPGASSGSAAPAAADDGRLPPYFPRVPKECKQVAKAFFDCFTTESEFGPGKVGAVDGVPVNVQSCRCGSSCCSAWRAPAPGHAGVSIPISFCRARH
jgi:hypothetical protein